MPRLKVTGYIDVSDLEDGDLDPNHRSGLSEQGQEAVGAERVGMLDDVEYEVVD